MQQALRIFAALVSALCILAVAGDAAAQKRRVVVLAIEDAPNPTLRKSVVSILRRARHTVISAKTFNKTARRLRARTMTSENLVRVAKRLRADGVLSGSVTEERGRYYLRLHLRSGATGETVQKLRLRLRRARLSKKINRQLRRQLLAAVKQLRRPSRTRPRRRTGGGDEIEVVSGVRATNKPKNGKGSQRGKSGQQTGSGQKGTGTGTGSQNQQGDKSARVAVRPDKGQSSGATGQGSGPGGQLTDGGAPGQITARPGPPDEPVKIRRAADIRVGASVLQRNLSFVLAEDFPEAPNGYQGPLAPAVSASGEVYPLELTGVAGTLLAAPGFSFRYDTALGLQTAIDTGGAVAVNAPTELTRYSIGGRLRFRFASLPTKPTITIGGGIGRLSFMVDPDSVPAGVILDVPNTDYRFFDPGAWVKLAVHPRVNVEVGGQALLVTDAGQIQLPEQYGGANITSFSVDFGVEFRATPHWRLRAAATYVSLGLAFIGNGEQTFNRDGDPASVDVDGAQDSYLGGSLALGYVY